MSGIIRQPEQAADVLAADAVPVVADLALATAGQLAQVPAGVQAAACMQAALFVAGVGLSDAPGQANPRSTTARSSPSQTRTRHSSPGCPASPCSLPWGADPAKNYPGDSLVQTFLRARGRADQDLLAHPTLDCTVVRPGWFRDGPGTGLVHLAAPGLARPRGRRLRATPQNESIAPSEPVEAAPCPHTPPTVFGLHHRCSLRRRHHIRVPESDNPRTVKGSDRP